MSKEIHVSAKPVTKRHRLDLVESLTQSMAEMLTKTTGTLVHELSLQLSRSQRQAAPDRPGQTSKALDTDASHEHHTTEDTTDETQQAQPYVAQRGFSDLYEESRDLGLLANMHTKRYLDEVYALGGVLVGMGELALEQQPSHQQLTPYLPGGASFVVTQALAQLKAQTLHEVQAKLRAQTDEFLRRVLAGVWSGQSPRTIAAEMAKSDGLHADWLRLSRTEIARALQRGTDEHAKALGVDYMYVPETPGACTRCQALNHGRVFPREALARASNQGRKPSQWKAAIPLHPNCTCVAIPASPWVVEQAKKKGKIGPEGIRIEYLAPAQR